MKFLATVLAIGLATSLAVPAFGAETKPITGPELQRGTLLRPIEGYWDADPAQSGLDRYIKYRHGGGSTSAVFDSMLVTMPDSNGQRAVVETIGVIIQGGTPQGKRGYREFERYPYINRYLPDPVATLILDGNALTIYECVPAVPGCPNQVWTRVPE